MKKMIQYTESIWYDNQITECKTLGEVLKTTIDLIELYGENTNIEFDAGYNNIDESVYVVKEREETDSEYKFRLKQEKKKAEKERKEYERLKAKFADN